MYLFKRALLPNYFRDMFTLASQLHSHYTRNFKLFYIPPCRTNIRNFSVLQWFKKLPNKCDSAFISFDVVEFYPWITEDLLGRALDFASNYATISAADHHVIMDAKQSPVSYTHLTLPTKLEV